MAIDIEKALEKVRQYKENIPKPQTRGCRGCGATTIWIVAGGLCEHSASNYYNPEKPPETLDCLTLFTTWLLGRDDLAPKVLACTLTSAERAIAIDEWLMSR